MEKRKQVDVTIPATDQILSLVLEDGVVKRMYYRGLYFTITELDEIEAAVGNIEMEEENDGEFWRHT